MAPKKPLIVISHPRPDFRIAAAAELGRRDSHRIHQQENFFAGVCTSGETLEFKNSIRYVTASQRWWNIKPVYPRFALKMSRNRTAVQPQSRTIAEKLGMPAGAALSPLRTVDRTDRDNAPSRPQLNLGRR
jgi:hypothetical protein